MLTNHPVNLNAINTSTFSAEFEDKVVHKMGEFSISADSIIDKCFGLENTSRPLSVTVNDTGGMAQVASLAIDWLRRHDLNC